MIINREGLARVHDQHKDNKVVLTSGTFDMLHAGHLDYLEAVKSYGEFVVVMLSGDARVKARKGSNRPIIPESDRARILDSLKIVDYVFIDPSELKPHETDPTYAEVLRDLQPNFYVTDGPDPRFFDLMDESKFIILDRMQPEPSTTSIIERIQNLSE